MRISKYMLIGALLLLAGPVLAEVPNPGAVTAEQSTVDQAGTPTPGSLKVEISADRPDATYVKGEVVRLTVTTNEDAYVTVLDVGPTGTVTQLFPNKFQTDNRVLANRPVEIAGPKSGARITVSGPVGAELIKVVASSKPLTVIPETQLLGREAFRGVDGGARAVVRDLQVAAEEAAQSEAKIVFASFALRTVESRPASTPEQQALVVLGGQGSAAQPARVPAAVVPAAAPQGPATPISVPAQQPFALALAADSRSYKVGEKVTLTVTTQQACNLTVVDITPAGEVRTLFPNPATPSNAISTQDAVLVAGGASANTLLVTGPAGTEQILAICSTDAAPVTQPSGDRAALARDLELVAARPAGTTSIASLTFSVQP